MNQPEASCCCCGRNQYSFYWFNAIHFKCLSWRTNLRHYHFYKQKAAITFLIPSEVTFHPEFITKEKKILFQTFPQWHCFHKRSRLFNLKEFPHLHSSFSCSFIRFYLLFFLASDFMPKWNGFPFQFPHFWGVERFIFRTVRAFNMKTSAWIKRKHALWINVHRLVFCLVIRTEWITTTD